MPRTWYRWRDRDLLLNVRAQANARLSEARGIHAAVLKVALNAPAVDGKANAALQNFLADAFGVSRSDVVLEQGRHDRDKLIRIVCPYRMPLWFGQFGGQEAAK